MNKEDIVRRLEALSREYNDLTLSLVNPDCSMEDPHYHEIRPVSKVTLEKNGGCNCEKLIKENKELKKEVKFLKDQLRRCNHQLNRYVSKGVHSEVTQESGVLYEVDKSHISRQNVFKMNSLLVAYDELLREQESAIQERSLALESCLKKVKLLEEENNKFYAYYEAFNNKDYNEKQLLEIAEDAKLLLESRHLLLEENNLLRRNEEKLKEELESKIESLKAELIEERSSNVDLQQSLKQAKTETTELKEERKTLLKKLKDSVPDEDHRKAVEQCARYLDKLKQTYCKENYRMRRSMDNMTETKELLEKNLNKSSLKVRGMKSEVIGCKKYLKKNCSLVVRQRHTIRKLKESRRVSYSKLKKLSHICNTLLKDRSVLLYRLRVLKRENHKFSNASLQKSEVLGKQGIRNKEERLQLLQKLAEKNARLQTVEEAWKTAVCDVERMRKLLRNKE